MAISGIGKDGLGGELGLLESKILRGDLREDGDLLALRQTFVGANTGTAGSNVDVGDDSLPDVFDDNAAGGNIRQLNRENVTNPTLPAGAEFESVAQVAGQDEFLEGQALGAADTVETTPVEEQDPFSTPSVDPDIIGNLQDVEAAQGSVSQEALVTAAQSLGIEDITADTLLRPDVIEAAQIGAVADVTAATGSLSQEATVTAADATESTQFQDAISDLNQELDNIPFDPRATVREQYAQLMDFEPDEIPDWAAGAVRFAQQQMSKRGIQSSTIAGEAITTALMTAALPIAQQDAQAFNTWQLSILDKKAQTGILRATHLASLNTLDINNKQQANVENARAALQIDLFNLDNEMQARLFNADKALQIASQNTGFRQQTAIENARNFLNVDLANLDVKTRVAIENASASLSVDLANLNNRQSSAVENARAFLNMDFTNLSFEQQTAVVNSQNRLQGLMSDQAARNAADQFNATNEIQVQEFFAGLSQDIAKYNSSQALTVDQFNSAMSDSREKFNVTNALLIEQANVQYLRDINTRNTAALNEENLVNSQNILNISNAAMAAEMTLLRDKLTFTFEASENAKDRALNMSIAQLQASTNLTLASKQEKYNTGAAIGSFVGGIVTDLIGLSTDGDPDTGF